MKQLIIASLCVCMALAASAGVPRGDAVRSRQVLNNMSRLASKPMGESGAGQLSLQQLMRERNVTPNDNRLANKTPRRSTTKDNNDEPSTMIVSMEARAVDDFDADGGPVLSDTVYSLGWKCLLKYYADYTYPYYKIENFYGEYDLPVYFDNETGQYALRSCELKRDTIKGKAHFEAGYLGWWRMDTVWTVTFFTRDCFFNYNEEDQLFETYYDDGSIGFDGECLIYIEEEIIEVSNNIIRGGVYSNYAIVPKDTLAYISPMLSGIYLLQPNGIHEFDSHSSQSSSGGSPYAIDLSSLTDQLYLYNVDGYGSGSLGPNPGQSVASETNTCSRGGLSPRPIDPRKPNGHKSILPRSESETDSVSMLKMQIVHDDDFDLPLGGGGLTPKPPKPPQPITPKPFTSFIKVNQMYRTDSGGKITRPSTQRLEDTFSEPVYMFQVDDSTVFVYNLFGFGSTMNRLKVNEDGTMNIPGQALYYDVELDDDFCNFTLDGDSLVLGNNGFVTPDTITWGVTVPHGFSNESEIYYDNNKLFFTDGSIFLLGAAQKPAIEVVRDDETYTFTGFTTEEGATVRLFTYDDEGNFIDWVNNPFVVERTDHDQVINLAAIASLPGKNYSEFCLLKHYLILAQGTDFLLGDVNNDMKVTIGDVVMLIDYLLSGNSDGFSPESADVNHSETINIQDVVVLINFLLSGDWTE